MACITYFCCRKQITIDIIDPEILPPIEEPKTVIVEVVPPKKPKVVYGEPKEHIHIHEAIEYDADVKCSQYVEVRRPQKPPTPQRQVTNQYTVYGEPKETVRVHEAIAYDGDVNRNVYNQQSNSHRVTSNSVRMGEPKVIVGEPRVISENVNVITKDPVYLGSSFLGKDNVQSNERVSGVGFQNPMYGGQQQVTTIGGQGSVMRKSEYERMQGTTIGSRAGY